MITTYDLTKKYGLQTALDGINVSIEKNKITGLIGPNGAGKSTFMKLICGYLPPTSGKVAINDMEVSVSNVAIRKMIGYLPENNPLYPEMYVKEYLDHVAGIYKIGDRKGSIEKAIDLTGLEKEQHKKIGELSKGYKQRVGLAQSIIHDPEILILDEPTSGLDPNQLIEIRNLIVSLGKNKTVLLSTHILQEVEAICDRVMIVNDGKIVRHEKTESIKNENGKNIVVEFDKDPVREDLLQLENIMEAKKVKAGLWIILGREGTDIRSDIFNFAVNNGMVVLSSQVKEKKLEEIFHELTGKVK